MCCPFVAPKGIPANYTATKGVFPKGLALRSFSFGITWVAASYGLSEEKTNTKQRSTLRLTSNVCAAEKNNAQFKLSDVDVLMYSTVVRDVLMFDIDAIFQ